MAKISIISEKITPLGGIIQEGELFSRYMDSIGNKNDQLLKKICAKAFSNYLLSHGMSPEQLNLLNF